MSGDFKDVRQKTRSAKWK